MSLIQENSAAARDTTCMLEKQYRATGLSFTLGKCFKVVFQDFVILLQGLAFQSGRQDCCAPIGIDHSKIVHAICKDIAVQNLPKSQKSRTSAYYWFPMEVEVFHSRDNIISKPTICFSLGDTKSNLSMYKRPVGGCQFALFSNVLVTLHPELRMTPKHQWCGYLAANNFPKLLNLYRRSSSY